MINRINIDGYLDGPVPGGTPYNAPLQNSSGEAVVLQTETVLQSGEVYTLTNDFTVPDNVVLKIESGATLKLEGNTNSDYNLNILGSLILEEGVRIELGADYSINISGALVVNGSLSQPVIFTSVRENPIKRDWSGIQIDEGAFAVIDSAIIEYAASAVTFAYSSGTVSKSLMRNNGDGVLMEGDSKPFLSKNTFTKNEYGIRITGPGFSASDIYPKPVVNGNNMGGNLYNAVKTSSFYGSEPLDDTIDATSNWWGTNDAELIEADIYHHPDDARAPYVNYSGYSDIPMSGAPNATPVANAGVDQNAYLGLPVIFDASNSVDSDGSIVAYEWTEGSTLLSQNQSFAFSDLTTGVHLVTLVVTDDGGASSSDEIEITVEIPSNYPPIANAGVDQNVIVGQTVNFDASNSTDSDGTIVTYKWKEGSSVLSQNQSFSDNSFSVGTHIITLTVTDDGGDSDSDELEITVEPLPNVLPVANAGEDQSVLEAGTVTLDGTDSVDNDGSIVSYQWVQLQGPTVSIDQGSSSIASFTMPALQASEFIDIELTVTDDRGDSETDIVRITMTEQNLEPIAYAGSGTQANEGELVTLVGYGLDEDGSIDAYTWSQTVGSPVVLTGAATDTLSFTMPSLVLNDTLTFELEVTDNLGATASDTVSVGRVEEVSIYANVVSGIAPLDVYFTIDTDSSNNITTYGMDYDGDLTLDVNGSTYDDFSYTYNDVGTYTAYVSVLDDQGNQYVDSITIEVLSVETEQATMKSQWDAMVNALLLGDIDTALNSFVEESKEEYAVIFGAMDSAKINTLFSTVTDLKLFSLNDGVAQCGAIRSEAEGVIAYPVRFVGTQNGSWKIEGL